MNLKNLIPTILSLLLSLLILPEAAAEGVTAFPALSAKTNSEEGMGADTDTLRVSLLTCWPGQEVYELAGHEAIRISGPSFDLVWNYGIFDFNQPNFIGRFVAGKTDYKVVSYPFHWFLPEYIQRGSRVEEQVLLLAPADKKRLLEALRENALPENATYRYNYVRNNCATRIVEMIDSASSRRIIYPDTIHYGTYRRAMRAYHRDYPWYQFGIDLVLGSGLDRPISRKEEMFVPVEMHDVYAAARFAADGGPVVSERNVLSEGAPGATLPPTPWLLSPTAAGALMLLLTIATAALWWRKGLLWRWWISIYFILCGLAGIIVFYLVFFSTHEATSPNLLLIWLNPLQLILGIGVWFRRWRWPSVAIAGLDAIALCLLLIARGTSDQLWSAPILLMMVSGAILAILYAIIGGSDSYYNIMGSSPASTATLSAKGTGRPASRKSGARRPSPATRRGGDRKKGSDSKKK